MNAIAAYDSIVDADTLCANLGDPAWRVIDCRHDLLRPDAGEQDYVAGHVPGAVFAQLDRDLSGPRSGSNGRHPLPSADALAERFRQWGVDPHTQIVAYDAANGQFAGRLWWLARWLGHQRVALLDGGWQAALKAGLAAQSTVPHYRAGTFVRRASLAPVVDADTVASARLRGDRLVIDARAADRYAGQNESIDPVAGHIPGAVNRFWQQNLRGDGRFKSAEQLRREFESLLGARKPAGLIVQCGSGVTACHHLVALHRARLHGAALYPGSWSEWIADPARPIAVGPDP
jgi:thiosulfate/3-mercaptopyruvate sulfurtransferase